VADHDGPRHHAISRWRFLVHSVRERCPTVGDAGPHDRDHFGARQELWAFTPEAHRYRGLSYTLQNGTEVFRTVVSLEARHLGRPCAALAKHARYVVFLTPWR